MQEYKYYMNERPLSPGRSQKDLAVLMKTTMAAGGEQSTTQGSLQHRKLADMS